MDKNIYKQRAINQWTNNPVGVESASCPNGSKEFFDEISENRYKLYAPWLKKTFKFERFNGKKVLEVGVGIGTDHREMVEAGAVLTGIDITPRSIELTRKNLESHGYHSNLLVADAEDIPFENDSFDIVYSFGVIHHSPNIQKTIDEINRVLVPEGGGIYSHLSSLLNLVVFMGISRSCAGDSKQKI